MKNITLPIINPIINKVTDDDNIVSKFYYTKSELYSSSVTIPKYVSRNKIPVLVGFNYEKTGAITKSDIVGYINSISYREATFNCDSLYFSKYLEKYNYKEFFLLIYPKITSHSLVNIYDLNNPINYRKVESIACAVVVNEHLVPYRMNDPRIKISVEKRTDYISWDEYFMGIAEISSLRSKDPNTQVGCCIVRNNKILSIGYNGFPNNCSDNEFPWNSESDDPLEIKDLYVTHAELNAILNYKDKGSLEGSTLYVTLFPCNECAKAIIQSGIKKIVYAKDKESIKYIAAKRMLDSAGVKYEKYIPTGKSLNINV